MTKNTKRVDELEIGDIVIFPHHKEHRTISSIKPPSSLNNKLYVIHTEETQNTMAYIGYEKVIYLGNNKKEENTMKVQKVDCSALCPYFDTLANEELTFQHTNIPVYVRQQLKNIHELFEDVLGLTLEEVKTLYFEKKMSKQESEIEDAPKTKKVKDLCIGDKIFLFLPYEDYEGEETITKLQEFSDTQIRIITDQSTEAILKKDKVISLVN